MSRAAQPRPPAATLPKLPPPSPPPTGSTHRSHTRTTKEKRRDGAQARKWRRKPLFRSNCRERVLTESGGTHGPSVGGAVGGGGGRARHGSPASLPQAPVVHPVSENSRTASVATTPPPPPDGGHDGCVPHLPRPRFLAPALPHSPLPLQPAEQHKPTCEPDRHHKCAAPANCAFGGGVPPRPRACGPLRQGGSKARGLRWQSARAVGGVRATHQRQQRRAAPR